MLVDPENGQIVKPKRFRPIPISIRAPSPTLQLTTKLVIQYQFLLVPPITEEEEEMRPMIDAAQQPAGARRTTPVGSPCRRGSKMADFVSAS